MSFATGHVHGYFSHGYGAIYEALAGAGVAFPRSAFADTINPAGMVMVGKRLRAELNTLS